MPTSKAKIDIIGNLLVALSISIFLFGITTNINLPEHTQETPTAAAPVITGTASLNIIAACSIEFKQGWNFISFCANETNRNITSVLSPINQSIRFVLEWDTPNQEFKVYTPRAATPPFDIFNLSKSYFVYYDDTSNTTVSLTGPAFNNINLSLQQGWETPNYPYSVTANITQYLDTIPGKYRFMQKWNYTPQEFMIYSALSSNNPFYQISAGEGQFILITDAGGADLFYNKTRLENG
ncbi:hypothetical protein GF358_01940 [Candidatus Woesearchaeota archaeon]|nr:hypothetical protein [Candidatus Woesearchaeota archaeon]